MHTCFSCQVMIYSSDRSKNTYYFVFVLYKCGLQLLGSISRERYYVYMLFIKSKQCNLCPCQANLMCKESLSCFCGSYLYSSVFLYSLAKIGLLSEDMCRPCSTLNVSIGLRWANRYNATAEHAVYRNSILKGKHLFTSVYTQDRQAWKACKCSVMRLCSLLKNYFLSPIEAKVQFQGHLRMVKELG